MVSRREGLIFHCFFLTDINEKVTGVPIFLICTTWSKFKCAFVSSRGFKAHFSVDFIERLFGCIDISRNVLEGLDRLPWETHSAVLLLTLVSS